MLWVATAFAALDLRRRDDLGLSMDYAIVPIYPSEPIGLEGEVARLWRRLVDAPVDDADLEDNEKLLLQEFADYGLASDNLGHTARLRTVLEPWFSSPLHELLTGTVASIAATAGIPIVVIKGPTLHVQGIRRRTHSGDIDVLTPPERLDELSAALLRWGWNIAPDVWRGTNVNHSVTLTPDAWGCEIDLHRRMPGSAVPDSRLFQIIWERSIAMSFGGIEARVPDHIVHSVLYAMHSLRPSRESALTESAFDDAVRALRSAGPDAYLLAREMKSDAAIGAALQDAFPDEYEPATYSQPLDWTWRAHPLRVVGYWKALGLAPWQARFRLALRLAWPSRDVVTATNRHAGVSRPAGKGSRIKRWIRALRR